jgi:GNAT superfamily N-acetyltransferase
MHYDFKQADSSQASKIWIILQEAIQRRKEDGSNQWQDGYPNEAIVKSDIEKGIGYVLLQDTEIVGYCALLINDEPEYANIKGKWLSDDDFVVFHRVAIAQSFLGKGLARTILHNIELWALQHEVYSLKADTNFDNHIMLALFEKEGYTYCGEVFFRGSPRKAFEKRLRYF